MSKAQNILLAFLPFAFLSCGDSSLTRTLPNVTGTAGDVLVVADKAVWQGPAGQSLRDDFAAPLAGMPQREAAFDLMQVNPSGFRDLFLTQRNVIIAAADSSFKEASLKWETDRWARTQMVARIGAPDTATLARFIKTSAPALRLRFNEAERSRLTEWLVNSAGRERAVLISDIGSFELALPSGYKSDFNRTGRMMISAETPSTTQSVMIAVTEHPVSVIGCIELADLTEKLMTEEVKGPDQQSYMVIEKQALTSCRSFSRDSMDIIEMRGLWTLEGGYMGGPFLSYAWIDPATRKAVVAIGFVYAPRDDKRELLRQVEALMYTLKKSS